MFLLLVIIVLLLIIIFFIIIDDSLFQPPPLIAGFPVLHYVVSYNTSNNSTLIHTQVNSSMTSYTVSGVPGVTYYITVFAVNALGQGTSNQYTKVNGKNNG